MTYPCEVHVVLNVENVDMGISHSFWKYTNVHEIEWGYSGVTLHIPDGRADSPHTAEIFINMDYIITFETRSPFAKGDGKIVPFLAPRS